MCIFKDGLMVLVFDYFYDQPTKGTFCGYLRCINKNANNSYIVLLLALSFLYFRVIFRIIFLTKCQVLGSKNVKKR